MTHVLVLHARLTGDPTLRPWPRCWRACLMRSDSSSSGRDPRCGREPCRNSARSRGIEPAARAARWSPRQLRFPAGASRLPGRAGFQRVPRRRAGGRGALRRLMKSASISRNSTRPPASPAPRRRGSPAGRRPRLCSKAAGRGLGDARAVVLGDSLRHGRIGRRRSFHLRPVAIVRRTSSRTWRPVARVIDVAVEEVGARQPLRAVVKRRAGLCAATAAVPPSRPACGQALGIQPRGISPARRRRSRGG